MKYKTSVIISICSILLNPVASFSNETEPTCSKDETGFTINYNTVSILEYIRFASKICNVNFVYDKNDLNFSVSVISDAPITKENVMATLVQLLRIHGLQLLENGNSLMIHKASGVKQIPTIVTSENACSDAPIITRVFRILNAKTESVAAIIKPMISAEALLEISAETRQLIITDLNTNVAKVGSLIEILDSPHTPLLIKNYEAKNNKLQFLVDTANQILAPITQGNPLILVQQPLAGSIFIVSTPELAERACAILETLDSPPKSGKNKTDKITPDNFLLYSPKNKSGAELLSSLKVIADTVGKSGINEPDLKETIDSGKFIPQSNALMFVGSIYSIAKVKDFLSSLDNEQKISGDSFFIYNPHYRDARDLERAVLEIAKNLKHGKDANISLIDSLESVKVNPLTNSLLFSGDNSTFSKIQELLASMDTVEYSGSSKNGPKSFIVYKIQKAPYSAIHSSLKYFAEQLDKSSASDYGLIQAITEMKYIEETNSILFTGTEGCLKRLQELTQSFDSNIVFPPLNNEFFIYKPKFQKEDSFFQLLKEVSEDLKKNKFTDPAFLQALQNVKWIKSSSSFLFTADNPTIKKIEELLASIDTAQEQALQRPGYFIYKLQNVSTDTIEEDLENLVKSFKNSGIKDEKLIACIENVKSVPETNSLLITGDFGTIEEVKKLILDFDYPRASSKGAQTNFLMYKPQHTTAAAIEKSIKDVATNMKKADLADPNLLVCIESMKYVEATNSLLFTGTTDALQKVQILLKDIDTFSKAPSAIQHVGKTSFLLYKVKHASGTQILNSIKSLSMDLKKSGASDKDFIETLQTAKYIRETNSILFTGPEDQLQRAESFAAQFDTADSGDTNKSCDSPTMATNFFVYKPVALTGPDLEAITQDFADNLKLSGLSDPELFCAINSMRWVEQTQSLIFTGTSKALDQIKQLITSFDIPSNLPHGSELSQDSAIQGIDNTNFLVYKLQYHKGDEIQSALRQIAKDLMAGSTQVNSNLLNAINSIQWIQITNSLLCSGDQETLSRLKELIKSLDIPLKQVFIEMLVIETNLLNALEFGLEWGGKYKYRNKFQGSINNITPSISTGGTNVQCSPPAILNELNNYVPTVPMPTITQNIPFNCGFDLGIIGQVIKHNGETFLSLGSLLSALQTDDETSVILTPKIITQDGRTSNIFVGSNVPFVGSFVNTNGQNTVQTSNIEYRDIGLNLTITPVLGNSDVVTLDINLDRTQTITDITQSQINFSNTSANGIVTSKTTMQTTVHVPDKNFLILSGFINNSNVKSTTGIPCLGGLPLIGAAFSKDNNTANNQNIVIFLRPHIINSIDDLKRVTEDQEEAFRDQQGTPFLIHQFDEGMELIKSANDD